MDSRWVPHTQPFWGAEGADCSGKGVLVKRRLQNLADEHIAQPPRAWEAIKESQKAAAATPFSSLFERGFGPSFRGSEVFLKLLLIGSFQAKLQDLSDPTTLEKEFPGCPCCPCKRVRMPTAFCFQVLENTLGPTRGWAGATCLTVFCTVRAEIKAALHSPPPGRPRAPAVGRGGL